MLETTKKMVEEALMSGKPVKQSYFIGEDAPSLNTAQVIEVSPVGDTWAAIPGKMGNRWDSDSHLRMYCEVYDGNCTFLQTKTDVEYGFSSDVKLLLEKINKSELQSDMASNFSARVFYALIEWEFSRLGYDSKMQLLGKFGSSALSEYSRRNSFQSRKRDRPHLFGCVHLKGLNSGFKGFMQLLVLV